MGIKNGCLLDNVSHAAALEVEIKNRKEIPLLQSFAAVKWEP